MSYQSPRSYSLYRHCLPVTWSLTTPSCVRMVRRLSPLIPEPTCDRRSPARAASMPDCFASQMRARRRAKAEARFPCWLRPSSQRTVTPLGLCQTCTALLILLRACPPAPEPRIAVHSRSQSRRCTCASVGSGRTATVTVLVWTRPRFSLGGMRCHRWPPGSSRNISSAPRPVTRKTIMPERTSRSSASKTPPRTAACVDFHLLGDERLRVVPAFSGANLNDGHARSLA